jgi:hypothetical protein
MPDWRDATVAFLELARLAHGRVIVTMVPGGTTGRPHLLLKAELVADDDNQMVVRTLASASVRLPGSNGGATDVALLSLGYELDKDWYRRTEGVREHTA